MNESWFDSQVLPTASAFPEAAHTGRQPFVQPVVEELGRLTELTLLGGSAP